MTEDFKISLIINS